MSYLCGSTKSAQQTIKVYQCSHGDLHLRLNRLTLSFTPAEFRHFASVITEASMRCGQENPASEVVSHLRNAHE